MAETGFGELCRGRPEVLGCWTAKPMDEGETMWGP